MPSGVPGAASNQPPVPGSATIGGGAAPLQAAQGGYGGGNLRRDAVTQYEVDKMVRVTRNATGTLKRLNAAVTLERKLTVRRRGTVFPERYHTEVLESLVVRPPGGATR